MKMLTAAASLLLFSLCTSAMVFGQLNANLPCWGRCRGGGAGGGLQGRLYDPRTVENVSGEVLSLDRAPGRGAMVGIHANLKSDKGETIAVHLGPGWYVDRQAVTLRQGDKISVQGSRITFDGKPAIIAAEVTKDGQILRLRDENGVPAWAGARRRSR